MIQKKRNAGDFYNQINQDFSHFDGGNFDASNFDAETLEHASQLAVMARRDPNQAGMALAIASKAIANNPTGGMGGANITQGLKGTGLSGVFKLNVKRLTADITEDLPVPIFGRMDSLTGYSKVINQQLPIGVRVVGFQAGFLSQVLDMSGLVAAVVAFQESAFVNSEKVRLLFSDGTNYDVVEISCEQNPYSILLEATMTDFMLINGMRFKINDSSMYDQLSVAVNPYRRTSLGKTTNDSTSLDTFFSPQQYQPGIIDYDLDTTIDKETTFCFNAIQDTINLNISIFVNQRQAWNAIKAAAKASK